jgi:serine phosphatase RsbU (regulator of sigma subunit)
VGLSASDHPSAGDLLRDVPVYDLAEHIVDVATERAGCRVGLYVIDIAGGELRRVAGDDSLVQRLTIPRAIGPEMAIEQSDDIAEAVTAFDPTLHLVALWLRHRAIAVLICNSDPGERLDGLAREAAAAIELATGYTDQFSSARRHAPVATAAQLQQELLPPRIAAARGAELAACILPAYDVGGDWFDIATSSSGAWLAVGDAVGKGMVAAALSALAVSAQRSVRQAGGSLDDAVWAIHDAVREGSAGEAFMTLVLAEWDARDHTISWINCGHPPPLLRHADGRLTDLDSQTTMPTGIEELPPKVRVNQASITPGDCVLMFSDGVYERRDAAGMGFGRHGIHAVLESTPRSAAAAIASLQRAVLSAGPGELRDDATMLAMRVLADDEHEPPVPGPGP